MKRIPFYISRFLKFVKTSYEPKLHLLFVMAWFLSLKWMLTIAGTSERKIPFDWNLVLGILTFFLILFLLRVVDEIKDLDYDKQHNPERPLVCGDVTLSELNVYIAITMVLVVLIHWQSHPLLCMIALFDMLYGTFLIFFEKRFKKIADHQFLSLVFTYPVNILLSVYLFVMMVTSNRMPVTPGTISIIVAFAAAFLHFEFVRKITYPEFTKPGERLYSNHLPARMMAFIAYLCAVISVGIIIITLKPWSAATALQMASGWSVLIPLFVASLSFYKFNQNRTKRLKLRLLGMVFVMTFYLSILLHLAFF